MRKDLVVGSLTGIFLCLVTTLLLAAPEKETQAQKKMPWQRLQETVSSKYIPLWKIIRKLLGGQ